MNPLVGYTVKPNSEYPWLGLGIPWPVMVGYTIKPRGGYGKIPHGLGWEI